MAISKEMHAKLDKLKALIEAEKIKSEICTELPCSGQAIQGLLLKLIHREKRVFEIKSKTLLSDTVRIGKSGSLIIAKSRIPTFNPGDMFKVSVDAKTNKITLTPTE